MTATVTRVTMQTVADNSAAALTNSIGLLVILLLLGLLILRELARAWGGPRSKDWIQALDVAVAPLCLAFVLIMLVRFMNLLHPA